MDSYGLKVGGAFDLMTFLKQPITVLRLLSWVFALVVLACVVNEGSVNRPDSARSVCVFGGNASACDLAKGVGLLALICSSASIGLDLKLARVSAPKPETPGAWSLLWFASFCFLAHQWQVSSVDDAPQGEGADAARATILFCFFSVFSWGGLALLALERIKRISFEEEYDKLFPPQT